MAEDETNVRGIIIHPELINQKVLDTKGRLWMLEELKNQPVDSFIRGMLFTKRIGGTINEAIREEIVSSAKAVFESYIEKEFRKELSETSNRLDSMIKKCLSGGDAIFRKRFIESLAAKGSEAFKALLESRFKEIGKAFSKVEPQTDARVYCSGIIPAGTRMEWRHDKGSRTVRVYLVEQPPSVRTVRFDGAFRRLAFPWMRFYIATWDGYHQHLSPFYAKESFVSGSSKLYCAAVPNVYDYSPHRCCLGTAVDGCVRLEGDWCRYVIEECFWGRAFISGHPYNNPAYWAESVMWREAQGRIPEISSLDKWEELTGEAPEKIINLPWKEVDKSAGQFGEELLSYFTDRYAGINKEDSNLNKNYQAEIVLKFIENLREAIYFAADNFKMDYPTQKEVLEFGNEALKDCQTAFAKKLKENCDELSREIIVKCLTTTEGAAVGGEGRGENLGG